MIGVKVYCCKITFRKQKVNEVFPFKILRTKAKCTQHLIIEAYY